MAKKKSLGVNYLFSVSYQILVIILPVITTPYISRVLGADGVGAYNYIYSFAHIAGIIAALGTNKYATREVAYHQNNKEENTKLFSEIMVLRFICFCIVFLAYTSGLAILKNHRELYLIMSLDILAVLFDISWFFQGLEEFKITVIRNFLIKIISVGLMFLLVKNPNDVWKYTLIMSGAMAAGQLTMWPYLKKYINRPYFTGLDIKKHVLPSLVFFIPTISIQVYTYLDKILIGMICTEADVGFYSQAEKIVKLVLTIISSFGVVLMPRMAVLLKNKNFELVNQNIRRSFSFVSIIGFPMMFGLIVVAPEFVPWFLGSGYEPSIVILKVLSPLILVMGIASTTGASILIPLGRQKFYNISIISGTIVNLILNLLLIPKYASFGAAVATIIAETTVTLSELFFMRDYLDVPNIIKDNYKYLFCTVVMSFVLLVAKGFFPGGIIGIMGLVIIGCIVYGLQLLIMHDSFLLFILNKVRGWVCARK